MIMYFFTLLPKILERGV